MKLGIALLCGAATVALVRSDYNQKRRIRELQYRLANAEKERAAYSKLVDSLRRVNKELTDDNNSLHAYDNVFMAPTAQLSEYRRQVSGREYDD